jgi:hypothetical protein
MSTKGAITSKARLVERFLRDPPFLGGSDWLGCTFSLVSTMLPMRFDFCLQRRRNWSTGAILRVVEVPLNALFECWSWWQWMFVVPF